MLSSADLPSIASGGRIAFSDPLRHHLEDDGLEEEDEDESDDEDEDEVGRGRGGLSFKLEDFTKHYPDQAGAYSVLSCEPRQGEVKGTLFRFPLRQKKTLLSSNCYSPDKVREQLFDSLRQDASNLLLFLTSVQQVEVYEQTHRGPCTQTFSITECQVAAAKSFQAQLNQVLKHRATSLYEVHELHRPSSIKLIDRSAVFSQDWHVTHHLGTANRDLQEMTRNKKLGFLVWTAVAIPALPLAPGVSLSSLPWLVEKQSANGRAFCFLPLPIETGLPAHIHGYFAVKSDRTSIKWPSSGVYDQEAEWNKLLVQHSLAHAYVSALSKLCDNCCFERPPEEATQDSTAAVYTAWPDAAKFTSPDTGPWRFLLECIRPHLFEQQLLYSHSNGGQWLSVAEALLVKGDETATQAVAFHCTESLDELAAEVVQTVYQLLLALDEPVVLLPPHVWRTLGSEQSPRCRSLLKDQTLHPAVLRQRLSRIDASDLVAAIESLDALSPLLVYLSHDLREEDIADELHGLPLLPICSGQDEVSSSHLVRKFTSWRILPTFPWICCLDWQPDLLTHKAVFCRAKQKKFCGLQREVERVSASWIARHCCLFYLPQ